MLSDACLLADPGDFSSANRYNVTFLQSVFTDGGDPAPSMLSTPIIISLVNDDICEDVEFFQARIVVTSDRLRVRIGPQDAVKVFITDDDCELDLLNPECMFGIRKTKIVLSRDRNNLIYNCYVGMQFDCTLQ